MRLLWEKPRRNFRDRLLSFRLQRRRLITRFRSFNWRRESYSLTVRLANAMERRWFPVEPLAPVGGKMLMFSQRGRNLGHAVLSVTSQRGGLGMGTVEWSNQWGRPRFKPHYEAVFDQQCIAEIYAAMRDMK